jgi:hypothetical protein
MMLILMMLMAAFLAMATVTMSAAAAPMPVEIHVSSSQLGAAAAAADGSFARPFKNIFQARDAMRAGLGRGQPRTVVIDGDHHLPEPLVLDARDAGTADAPVVWKSRPGAAPARLTGGVKLDAGAFKPAVVPSGAAGVVKAKLYSDEIGLNASVVPGMSSPYPFGDMELFYEGQPMHRARSPNIAADNTWMWSGYENVTTVANLTFGFLDSEKAEMWAPAAAKGDLWLHGFFKFDWRDTFIKIDSITKNASNPAAYTVARNVDTPPQYPFTKGCRFYAVAALELLDAPGEYHIDKASGVLYFLPPAPLKPDSDLVVSVLSVVVSAAADHHKFEGLTISVSRDVTFTTVDASTQTVANNVTIDNCVLTNSGQACVVLQGSDHRAKNNTVFGCGTAGISLISGDVTTLTRGNTSAVGNMLHDCSRIVRTYTPGIGFSGVGMYVANNTIMHQPHTSITGGGNDNLFEFNHIEHSCFETVDTGAFYVGRSWSQRGNVVRFNTFDTIRPTEKLAQASCSQNAFYLDDQMSGYDFYGNTVKNATTGVLLGGGRRNRIHSNTFIDNDLDIAFDNRGMNWMADYCNYNCTGYTPNAAQSAGCFKTGMEKIHYQQPPYATHYPELVNIYENHPCVPINNVIEDNVYCHARSMNMTGSRHGFIDATESQVESWLSTMSNNRQVCE